MFAALPPLLAVVFAALLLSMLIVFGVFAVALAPVGLALFGLAWLVQRVFRGAGHPPPWAGYGPRMRRGRHPFLRTRAAREPPGGPGGSGDAHRRPVDPSPQVRGDCAHNSPQTYGRLH